MLNLLHRNLTAGFGTRPGLAFRKLFESQIAQLKRQNGIDFNKEYYEKHRDRFLKTAGFIPAMGNAHALEIGATDLFQVALKHVYGFSKVSGTYFDPDPKTKTFDRTCSIGAHETTNTAAVVNLEHDIYPFENGSVDFILCGEVIEHMDVDPMFMLAEINRIARDGAILLITTPNSCSARNFWKMVHGYRPHFFMQYEKSRSPYRHNFEHDIHSLVELSTAAGFEPLKIETHDVFEPPLAEALTLLKRTGADTSNRGDCIFMVAKKVSGVVDRWPAGMYV